MKEEIKYFLKIFAIFIAFVSGFVLSIVVIGYTMLSAMITTVPEVIP